MIDRADIRFERFYSIEGPSKSNAGPFVQDDQGFMWFGTPHGLNRFDGYAFKVFTPDPQNAKSLSGSFIHALFKDRSGTLWVGCNEFLNKFNSAAETFTRYPVRSVFHISQDGSGTLWLSTTTGLYALNPENGHIRRYSHDPSDPTSLESNDVKSSGEDKEGVFWVATSEGLDSFDRSTGKVTLHIPIYEASHPFSFYEDRFGVFWIYHVSGSPLAVFDRKTNTLTQYSFQYEASRGLALTGITAMLEDQNGALWLATNGAGLLKFDRENRRFVRYRHHIDDPESLAQNSVRSLFRDREGIIWASLGGFGLTRFTARALPFKRYRHDFGNAGDRDEPFVGAIHEDRQGILWIGTHDGLHRVDRGIGRYRDFQLTRTGEGTDVITIAEDRLGYLWVGTYGHGLFRLDPRTGHFRRFQHKPADRHSLSNDIVPRVFVDHTGTVWAATHDGLDRFDAATGRFKTYKIEAQGLHPYYLDVTEDQQGILWLGTESSGLQRFDPSTGQFTTYQRETDRPDSLSDNRVNSVRFDHSGTMWVATQEGLNKFDAVTGRFAIYSQREGLPSNDLGCILEDNDGDLWMSTDNGVARFNPETESVKSYSNADGLPGPDLTGWGACYKSTRGEMFFGGFNGATAFFPGDVMDSKYIPPIALTDFRLFGAEVNPGANSPLKATINYSNSIVLSHAQNIFSIGFSALSYLNPTTNRYRYKLEGLRQDWIQVGSDRRFATYTTLAPGKYTFRVEGATSRGPWDEPGAILHIEILPAWWNTWWFRVLSVAICLALLYGLYQLRTGQLQRQEKHLREVINAVPAMVWTALPDGSNVSINSRWTEYTGSSAAGLGWQNAVHPDDLQGHLDAFRASSATGLPLEDEVRLRRADGEYRWFLVQATPLRDEKGDVSKWYGIVTDVEDRRRAERTLLEQAGLLGLTHDAIFVCDMDGILKYWNHGAQELYGWTAQEAIGKVTHELLRTIFPTALSEIVSEVVRVDRWEGELTHTKKDGSQIVVASRWSLQRDQRGSPVGFLETNNDITERKRAVSMLAGEKRILEMVAKGDFVAQILDALCRLVEEQASGVMASILLVDGSRLRHGAAPSLPEAYNDAIDGAAIGPSECSWGTAAHLGKQVIVEDITIDPLCTNYRHLALRHSLRACWSTPVFSSRGKVIGTFAMYYREPRRPTPADQEFIERITHLAGVAIEPKLTEEVLRRSESYLAEAQMLTHTGSCALDGTSREIHYWSEEMFRLFGFDPQQGLPTWDQWVQRIHPEDRDKFRMAGDRMFLEKVHCDVEFRTMKPDGVVKHVHAIGHPVLSPTGELIQVVGTMVDITERRRGEESVRRSESYLAQAQQLAHIGSWAWDATGRNALYVSDEWCRIYGFDPQDGMPSWEQLLQHVHPEDRARLQLAIDRAVAEKSDYDLEFRILCPLAPARYVHSVGHPILGPSGEVVQYVGVSMDVTESRQAEQEHERLRQELAHLAHLNRVSTMGELAASLAHEIKQPIGAAVTNADACVRLLNRDQPDIPEAHEAALEMAKDARRAAEIIDRVRSLYQKGSSQPEIVEVNEVISEMVVMLQNEANRHSVTIRTDLAERLPSVVADRVQLQQVLLNLMLNGIEAIRDTSGEVSINSKLAEDGQLLVSVTDTGVGLPTENADQIFNPFFTTKSQGTGLGLAITRSIIESHGGRIWASPNAGRGATFHFTLPSTVAVAA